MQVMAEQSHLERLQEELDLYRSLLASCDDIYDTDQVTEDDVQYWTKQIRELTRQCRELQEEKRQAIPESQTLDHTQYSGPGSNLPGGSSGYLRRSDTTAYSLPSRKRPRPEPNRIHDENNQEHPAKSRRSSPDGPRSLALPEYDHDVEDADLSWLNAEMKIHNDRVMELQRRRQQEEEDAELARKLQSEFDDEQDAPSSQPATGQNKHSKPSSQYSQATFQSNGSFKVSNPAPTTNQALAQSHQSPALVNDDDDAIAIIDPHEFQRKFPSKSTTASRTLPSSFGQYQPSSSSSRYTSVPGRSVYGGLPGLPGLSGLSANTNSLIQAGQRAVTGVLSRIGIPGSSPNTPYDVDHYSQFSYPRRPWMNLHPDPQVDSVETEEQIRDLLNNIRPDEEISPEEANVDTELAGMLKITLMPHQRKGVVWMKKAEEGRNKGGILADDMGLGKTIQAVALMLARPVPPEKKGPTLIVCTVALMDQWRREIKRLIRPRHELTVVILHGAKAHVEWETIKHFDVILTSYGTLGSELTRKTKWADKLKLNPNLTKSKGDFTPILDDKAKFYRVFLDEAQNIKNRNTLTAMAACRVQAEHRWCLTGTPMQNGPDEMYSLIKFCRIPPYNSYEKWSKEIGRPLKGRNDVEAQSAMRKLQAILKAILLRRTKKSTVDGKPILQLPEKHVVEERTVFNDDELRFYSALEQQSQIQFNRYLKNGQIGQNYSKALVLLLRLRQCCCSPQLVMNSADFVLGSGVEGLDLLQNARDLPDIVHSRLEECDLECPVCFDAVENPIIFNPCGHTLCHDCFSRMVDNVHAENANDIRCPHCRATIDTKKITDLASFKEAFMNDSASTMAGSKIPDDNDGGDDSNSLDTDSEGESDDSDDVEDLRDFIVNDDEPIKEEDDEDDNPDDVFDDIRPSRVRGIKKEEAGDTNSVASSSRKSRNVRKRGKTMSRKGKGKGKKKEQKHLSLADLRKEGLKSRAAKKKYLKQLGKIYEPSAKIEKTLELLHQIHAADPDEKVIVFSSFTSFLDLVEVPLFQDPDLQHYTRYDGSMTAKDRNKALLQFTDNPQCNVILVSLKAGNAGLNLTVANHVILLDPFWNPFVEYQAADRCHRIGQQREVYVHRVVIGERGVDHAAEPERIHTVEDRILQLQEKKRKLVESALDENAASTVSRLGTRELGFLFGVNSLPAATGS